MQPTFDQAFHLLSLIRDQGLSLEKLQALYALGILSDVVGVKDPLSISREAVRLALGYDPSVFRVKLGGPETTDSIVQVLREGGFWINEYITQENFPLTPSKNLQEDEIEIIDPDCSFSEEEGLRILKKKGLARPTHEHAIQFAGQWGTATTSQEKPFVVFLHEPWQDPSGNRRVVYLRRPPSSRKLCLNYPGSEFNDYCVLAGVRPRKQPLAA